MKGILIDNVVTVNTLSNTKKEILINVPAHEVDEVINEFLASIRAEAQIPGFRKGKAPIDKLKSFLGIKVRAPVSQTLVNKYFVKAIKDHEINPVSNPEIKNLKTDDKYVGSFGFDNSYSVELIVDVLPKVTATGYKGLDIRLPDVDEDQVFDERMSNYCNQFAARAQVDRPAQLDDSVVIDFVGYIDDKAFDGGAAKGHSLPSLGKSGFIPGFEDQVVGMSNGDQKDIVVTFPDNYNVEHLAGKEARFNINMHNVIEVTLAKVDENLALMLGHDSVDDMNIAVKEEVFQAIAAHNKQAMEKQICDILVSNNDIEIPDAMIEQEKTRLKAKTNVDDLPNNILNELHRSAKYNVQRAILIDSIYEQEDSIEIMPNELDALLSQHAKANNQTKDDLVSILHNTGQMDNFMATLKSSKVIEFIVNNVKKEEKANE